MVSAKRYNCAQPDLPMGRRAYIHPSASSATLNDGVSCIMRITLRAACLSPNPVGSNFLVLDSARSMGNVLFDPSAASQQHFRVLVGQAEKSVRSKVRKSFAPPRPQF